LEALGGSAVVGVMKAFVALLAVLCCLAPLRADEEEKNPIDVALEAALEKESSTAGMVGAYDAARTKWDKQMNATYKKLKEKMDEEEWQQVVEAQKAWIAFRNAQLAQIGGYYGKKDGTMWRVTIAEHAMQVTKDRARYLSRLLEDLEQ
jgi:uncharacterized protein YecT (DUF1311 family)